MDSQNFFTKNSPVINTVLLVITLVVAVVALTYSIQNNKDLNNCSNSPSTKERMTGGRWQGKQVINALKEKACGGSGCGIGPTSGRPVDGQDYANQFSGNSFAPNGKLNCPPTPLPEAHHPWSSGGPTSKIASAAYNANYPDETDPHALTAKAKYGCAPDNDSNAGDCDYSLNADSLLPSSWREGTDCPGDSVPPNSLWAKYSPTKDAYYRSISASGSARLSVNTRSPLSRITGPNPLLLRSSVSVPLSSTQIPWNDSEFRLSAIANSTGMYPGEINC